MIKSEFKLKVLNVVRNIPAGQVMSYAEVARQAGFPGAARAVGMLMKSNFVPDIPCHRVIRSDGLIGEFNRGKERKIELLRKEGVLIENGRFLLKKMV